MSIRCHGETLSEVTLPPHEPQPRVIDGGSAVEKPMAPCVVGELTMMREAGISHAEGARPSRASACGCPRCDPCRRSRESRSSAPRRAPARPRRRRRVSARASPSRAGTRARRRPRPPSGSASPAGRSAPPSSQSLRPSCRRSAGSKRASSVVTTFASWSASAAERKCAPCAMNSSRTCFATGASATTACSEAQMVPLSKVFPVRMFCTAIGTSAVRSTNDGDVAGADAEGGLARRVGRAHETDAARGEDDGRLLVLHQSLGAFDATCSSCNRRPRRADLL